MRAVVEAEHDLDGKIITAGEDVWLGDLAGFEIGIHSQEGLELRHRCGWSQEIPWHDQYLGNIVTRALKERQTHDCRPRTGYGPAGPPTNQSVGTD